MEEILFYPYKGIGKTPFDKDGNGFSQCIDSDTIFGVAGINKKTERTNAGNILTETTDTFLRNGATVIETAAEHSTWVTGTAVTFTTTSSLPTGLSAGTTYFLRKSDNDTFSVHTTFSGAKENSSPVSMSDAGVGTHTVTAVSMGEPIKFLNDRMIDDDGTFWQWSSGYEMWYVLSPGSGSGVGFEEWQGYALLFRGGDIDAYRLSNGTLTADWQTDAGGVSILDTDNVVYIASGNVVRALEPATGAFDPSSGATYQYSSEALDLPTGETITTLSQIGSYLAIGTVKNKVYLWDTNFDTFELPVLLPETPRIMTTVNNILYVVLDNGDMVAANGSTYQTVLRFPKYIFDNEEENPSFTWSANAWRVENDKLYIGIGTTSTTNPLGVFSYNITTGDFTLEHISSSGSTGGSSAERVRIKAIQNGDTFFIGNTIGGSTDYVDKVALEDKYTSGATAYSPFFLVGSNRDKVTFKQTEVAFIEPIQGNHTVEISYRRHLNDNWTVLKTISTVGLLSDTIDKAIDDIEMLQLRIRMTTTNQTTPRVLYIRVY